jgi:methane/ammonia monooxygenase subunit B
MATTPATAKPLLRRSVWVAKGEEAKLITPTDLAVSVVLGVAVVLTLLIGWLDTVQQYPTTVPLQKIRIDIPTAAELNPAPFVEVVAEQTTFNKVTRTATMDVEVTNTGDTPITLREYAASTVEFKNQALEPDAEHLLVVEPGGPINPGQTRTLTLTMQDPIWEETQLLTRLEAQLRFGGVLIFEDAAGVLNVISIDTALLPEFGA